MACYVSKLLYNSKLSLFCDMESMILSPSRMPFRHARVARRLPLRIIEQEAGSGKPEFAGLFVAGGAAFTASHRFLLRFPHRAIV